MFRALFGTILRIPLLLLIVQHVPDSETRLISACVFFAIGDMLIASYNRTRGASPLPASPSGPATKKEGEDV